ncbi:hypothetical protein ACVFYP_08220 [Roseomonas sp. F4]
MLRPRAWIEGDGHFGDSRVKMPTASTRRRAALPGPLPAASGELPVDAAPAYAPPEFTSAESTSEESTSEQSASENGLVGAPWDRPWAAGGGSAATPSLPPAAPRRRRRWPWHRPGSAEAAAARLRAAPDPPAAEPVESAPIEPEPLGDPAAPSPPSPQLPSLPLGGLPPLRLPFRALVEGFGGLLLLAVVDRLITGGTGFSHAPASPFVLPILYVAARYGLLPGLVVAAAAGTLRLGLAVTAGAWTSGAWMLPLMWPLAAMLIGGFSDLQRRRLAAAEAAAAAAAEDRESIAEANQRLAERMLELEARLNARLQAGTAIFQAARIMGQGTEGVIRGATGLLRAATGCTACSFWLNEDRTLHLVAAEGWPQHLAGAAALSQTLLPGPLTDAIRQGRGALVATRLTDRLALGDEGVMAAPVVAPWDGALLGMVKIEEIGFSDFGLDTIAALEAAAGWIGAALAEARAREASESAGGIAGLPGPATSGGLMVPGEEAGRAISVMTGLARRLGFDLVLLSAEIPAGARAAAALEATRAAMAEAFRGSDLLLEARLEDRRLSVLLPGTAVAGAEIAAARLRALLAERAPSATAQVVVGVALLHGLSRGAPVAAGTHGR